jgi:hypothetical protein
LIRREIVEAFGDVPRPDLKGVRPLGCCEEHDPDFDWYRQHTWQELEQEFSLDYLDRFEFFALHPSAYHYFVPGLLLGMLESIVTGADGYHAWDWVRNLLFYGSRAGSFGEEYLTLFTAPQREAVASLLEFFNESDVERKGYTDKNNRDVERALSEIWRAES